MTRCLVLILLTLLPACDSEIKVYTRELRVRLRRDQCDDRDLKDNVSCLYLKLQDRQSALSFSTRVGPIHYLNTLEELESNYLSTVFFEHVPEEGVWDLRLAGFSTFCDKPPDPLQAHLCGEVTELPLPPPTDHIDLFVDCKSDLITEELLAKIKNCSTNLLFGGRP